MEKQERHKLIRDIIAATPVEKQSQLMGELNARGVRVTQATVSRDIAELALTRTRRGARNVYTLPIELGGEPMEILRRMVVEFVGSIAISGNIVVLKTAPGTANVVAGATDRAGLAEVLGTVAGDDTVIVVTVGARGANSVEAKLGKWLD